MADFRDEFQLEPRDDEFILPPSGPQVTVAMLTPELRSVLAAGKVIESSPAKLSTRFGDLCRSSLAANLWASGQAKTRKSLLKGDSQV